MSHGAGHARTRNVSDVAVHCATPHAAAGLDPTFGSGGRVSTPVGAGKAEAVRHPARRGHRHGRPARFNGGIDFALTRHDADGNLDTSFGTGGIVTTDLGSPTDEAFDAALHPDGGIVVVGRTDAAGSRTATSASSATSADGTRTRLRRGGIVTTDFAGQADQANAVAVQPDGKIVVAGLATGASRIDSDFALARYNADGTLDMSFGGDGIVHHRPRHHGGRRPRRRASSPTAGSSSPAPPTRTSRSRATPPTAQLDATFGDQRHDDHRLRLGRLRQRRRADRRRRRS